MAILRKINFPSIFSVDYAPIAKRFILVTNRLVVVDIDIMTKKYLRLPASNINEVLISKDEKRFVLKNTSGRIFIMCLNEGIVLLDLKNGREGEGGNFVNSPCGNFFIYSTWDGEIISRNWQTGAVMNKIEYPECLISHTSISDDGILCFDIQPKLKLGEKYLGDSFLVYSKSSDRNFDDIVEYRFANFRSSKSIISPCGKYLAVLGCTRSDFKDCFRVYNLNENSLLIEESAERGSSVSWSNCGRFVAFHSDEKMSIRAVPNFKEIKSVKCPGPTIFFMPQEIPWILIGGDYEAQLLSCDEFFSERFLGLPFPSWWEHIKSLRITN